LTKVVRIFLFNNKSLVADRCVVGDSYMIRLKGLIGKKSLLKGEGLWLPNCTSVHMWFMKTAIDVLFLKKNPDLKNIYEITSLHSHVKPWRLFPLFDFYAQDVLELQAGAIQEKKLKKGDLLCIESSF